MKRLSALTRLLRKEQLALATAKALIIARGDPVAANAYLAGQGTTPAFQSAATEILRAAAESTRQIVEARPKTVTIHLTVNGDWLGIEPGLVEALRKAIDERT